MTQVQRKGPTFRYGVIQAGFWIDYLIINSFAAVFLSGRGFSTAAIGGITSAGALASCVLQQVSGDIADRSKRPLKHMIAGFFLACTACFALLKVFPEVYASTLVFYTVAFTLQSSIAPLLNSLCLQFTNRGYDMNFGLARSMGSFGYATGALIMGQVTEHYGAEIILPIYMAIYLILLLVLASIPVPAAAVTKPIAGNEILKDEKPSTMKEFFHKYHRFELLMAGFVLEWFLNSLLGTYMIYFVRHFGGGQADMGLAFAVMAYSEIPAVMFGTNLMGRIGADTMLRISGFGGILKAILFLLSPNIRFFVWCNIAHLLYSGFYQVAAVYYVYRIVGVGDIAKGQAIMGIATGGVCMMLANLIGGFLLERVSIPFILIIGLVANIAAFVLIYLATDPKRFPNEKIRSL